MFDSSKDSMMRLIAQGKENVSNISLSNSQAVALIKIAVRQRKLIKKLEAEVYGKMTELRGRGRGRDFYTEEEMELFD